jgi:hypothetical protein
MAMHGADVAALRGLAGRLRRRQLAIDETRRRLAAVVDGLPWSGPDHDRFVDEWRRLHVPALVAVATEMSTASRRADAHADEQERASRPDR